MTLILLFYIKSFIATKTRRREDAKLVSPSDYHNPAYCQDS